MNKTTAKIKHRDLRAKKVRAVLANNTERPRLSVFISNKNITAQIIDDNTAKTLAYVTTIGQKSAGKTMTEKAQWVGESIAKAGKSKKVVKVVFDRGPRLYHGRIKALAEKARQSGLEF
jgi:large subunit ribosomal protein L18